MQVSGNKVNLRGTWWFLAGIASMLLIGWVAFPSMLYENIPQPIQFSHYIHTREKVGLNCDDCHAFRADGSFSGIPTIQTCAKCHQVQMSDSPEEKKVVEEYVSKNREIPWLVYARQPQNAFFSHAPHVKLANIECSRCHGPHGSTNALPPFERNRISGYSKALWGPHISGRKSHEWEGMMMDDCSHCHNARHVHESCLDCHK
jgi:hypothetical protein